MKFYQLFFAFIILSTSSYPQNQNSKLNLDFEQKQEAQELPKDWFKWGNYTLSTDSTEHYSGKNSVKIDGTAGNAFGSVAYRIPSKYKGKKIKLEGYMKLKNVANGHAGLLLRLDGDGNTLEFDNMASKGIVGSIDWKKYQITLPYNEKTEDIFVAGILSGSGTVWFDDFKVTVDGKDIQTLKEVERIKTKGEQDIAFDEGSKILFHTLTPQKLKNLELLGKIWGFLKYHHPAIATGDYNWDYELFRILPDYLNSETIDSRNQLLLDWIDTYGEIEICTKCEAINPNAYLKPDFKWFDQYDMSKGLSDRLKFIHQNRFQGKHYYIAYQNVGNPKFQNEKSYSSMPYPDAGFRLLTLYRFWNMIEYYFPYKHLTDKEWNTVLGEYIEQFVNAKNELEFELATVELIGEVKDTHANLWGGNNAIQEWKGSYFPPFHIRFRENQPVVTDYYNPELQEISKIKVGDVITAVNGKPINQIVDERNRYYPASNQPTRLRDIGENLLRSQDSVITITFKQDGIEKTHQLELYQREKLNTYRWYKRIKDKASYHWINKDIGYITLQIIKESDIPLIKKEFIDAKGIVIDIRNYPSYFVPFALGQYFIDKFTPFARFTSVNPKTPGEFILDNGVKIPPRGKQYKGKLVVLVNELSQSQAEYTAMAFRASPNCTIIGSTTAGADGNVSRLTLPGGMSSMISGIGVHYPDGSETQRIGIVPDVEVLPTIKGIKEGRDEVLEKALEIINKG